MLLKGLGGVDLIDLAYQSFQGEILDRVLPFARSSSFANAPKLILPTRQATRRIS